MIHVPPVLSVACVKIVRPLVGLLLAWIFLAAEEEGRRGEGRRKAEGWVVKITVVVIYYVSNLDDKLSVVRALETRFPKGREKVRKRG